MCIVLIDRIGKPGNTKDLFVSSCPCEGQGHVSALAGAPQSFPISTDLFGLQELSPALQTHNKEILHMRGKRVSRNHPLPWHFSIVVVIFH